MKQPRWTDKIASSEAEGVASTPMRTSAGKPVMNGAPSEIPSGETFFDILDSFKEAKVEEMRK